jgi:signal transduction histidine kinase/DNA-binding response OmpR family regulator/ligand-binding sensor domain-containing protein
MIFKGLFWFKINRVLGTLACSAILSLLLTQPCLSQSFSYRFKYLTVDEGLSHTDANDIAQDSKGYLWIATNFGLDRYDGYVIKKFYNTNVPKNNAQKNRIQCLQPDKAGKIWLGTEDGLQCFDPSVERYLDFQPVGKENSPAFSKLIYRDDGLIYGLDGNKLKAYSIKGGNLFRQQLILPHDLSFFDIKSDRSGNMYFATDRGLWYLAEKNTLKKLDIAGFNGTVITSLCFNKQDQMLFASSDQVLLTRSVKAGRARDLIVYKRFSSNKHQITQIVAGVGYWLNTGSSIIQLDQDLRFIQTITNNNSVYGLNSNAVFKLLIDRSECLWICTAGGGVNFSDLNQKLFYTLQHDAGNDNSLSGNYIRSVLEDGESLWIGTNANGLNQYHFKTRNYTFYNSYNTFVKLKNDAVSALALDNMHNLWIGTKKGINILKADQSGMWLPPGAAQFPGYEIETIARDCYGNMWFGNHDKMGVIWKDRQNYYRVKEYTAGHFILPDQNKPQLLVSTRHGLKQLFIDKEGNIVRTVRYEASASANSLSSSYTSPLCKQNDSTYWVGTIGGGLNKLFFTGNGDRYAITRYNNDRRIFKDVEALEMDNTGSLWLGGNALIRFNPTTGNLIRYEKSDGLQGNSFKVRASYHGASGRLYFGGINGLNYFYPGQIKNNEIDARPAITGILINNQLPGYEQSDSAKNYIGKAVGYNNELSLNHRQNNIVLSFSAMHFANPLKCKYRYRLVGFDPDWRYTDGQNPTAAYNNLDYKNYRFVVAASNNDGLWNEQPAEIAITITPPWWSSIIAKICYGLLFLCSLLAIYIYQARWYRLKNEVALRALDEKKREEMHQQREELYQQQLQFFTNISHEFRTPLTLIFGPLEKLITQNKNTLLNEPYQLMLRNAQRLMNLISELMNFKKVSDSLIKLHVRPLVIDQFCENLAQEFRGLADKKRIRYNLVIDAKNTSSLPLTGLFDAQVLEKVLFNLLSNAFKYTPAGGQISFELLTDTDRLKPVYATVFEHLYDHARAKKYIYFRIIDSGIGISADSITQIFDRYYRVSNDHLGSGVGLALVKSLTLLHRGDIFVSSESNKGTEVVIAIPWGDENYSISETEDIGFDQKIRLETIDKSVLLPVKETSNTVVIPKSGKQLLIVDDNDELRTFLKQTFEVYYHIHEARDGYSALEVATQKLPDLIISDVMMPGMGGIELCREIKGREDLKHIPIIILSARDALAAKIEGLESGADLYFAKPVSMDLLLLTVKNLFEQSENIKLRYSNDFLVEATKNLSSEKDKEFAAKLLSIIEQNMENPDLDVDFLCDQLYISRTKLYKQIKKISDQPVSDFIRTIRLKKAIYIMTHEDVTMSEVANRIGLQSNSNFSRAFKKEFGKSPLQFIQDLKNNAAAV